MIIHPLYVYAVCVLEWCVRGRREWVTAAVMLFVVLDLSAASPRRPCAACALAFAAVGRGW